MGNLWAEREREREREREEEGEGKGKAEGGGGEREGEGEVRNTMYSMPYYTNGCTATFLFLEPTALIYIYIKRTALLTSTYVVLEI